MEPRMSWRHSRQSNEMDSVNRATSAPGSPRNLPLRWVYHDGPRLRVHSGRNNSSLQNTVLLSKRADEAVPAPLDARSAVAANGKWISGRKKGRWRFRATLLSPVPNDLLGYMLKIASSMPISGGTEKAALLPCDL